MAALAAGAALMPARRRAPAGLAPKGVDVRVGDEVTRDPSWRASDTFRCPRCGCFLTLSHDTALLPQPEAHQCCGLRFQLEVRVETLVVAVLDAGECPIHGPWPGPVEVA